MRLNELRSHASAFNADLYAFQMMARYIIEEYLCPDETPSFGEVTECLLSDARIAMRRVGNRTGVPRQDISIEYSFASKAFDVTIRAIWSSSLIDEPYCRRVDIVSYKPPEPSTLSAFHDWMLSLMP